MPYQAKDLVTLKHNDALLPLAESGFFSSKHLVIGAGTNTVFCQDYAGTLLKLDCQQVNVRQDAQYYYVEAEAGHDWHALVQWTLQHQIYGLENLALIPGTVGAAPIQNIGAYGVEFADVCDYIEYFDKQDHRFRVLEKSELYLGYRDSIFKQSLKDKVVITKVGFKLNKHWQPVTNYHGLESLDTPQKIYDAVIEQRRCKLPDYHQLPNAGSFFKNPIVDKSIAEQLLCQYPQIPCYSANVGKVKLSAAWLIEQCDFKGKKVGDVGVYLHHALILVNHGQGTGAQLLQLISEIIDAVSLRFDIILQPEVRLI